MNIIGDFSFIGSVADFGTSPALSGAFDVATQDINGTTYVYVSGNSDNGVQVLAMADDGSLTPVMSVADTAALGLFRAAKLEAVKVGKEHFLAVSSTGEDAITMFRLDDDGVGTDGHLVHIGTYRNVPQSGESNAGEGLLDYAEHIETVSVGNKTFLLATGYSTDSVSVYEIGRNGALTRTDAVRDGDAADLNLNTAADLVTHTVKGKTFVFVGSDTSDAGLNVFQLNNKGKLSLVETPDAPSTYFYEMTAGKVNGRDLLFASDISGDAIYAYRIGNNGNLTEVAKSPRFIDGNYSDIYGLEMLEAGGVSYLLATARNQDTLMVLTLDENDDFQIVQTISDATELHDARGLTVKQMGDRVFILVASQSSARVSVYEIGGGDDPLVGTGSSDRIVGLSGDDDLLGLGGGDILKGLAGDDLLSGRGGNDTLEGGKGSDVLLGHRGNDVLLGGDGADILKGGIGRDTASYAGSANAVDIDLGNGTASGGHANGDILVEVESLIGSGNGDTLVGSNGANKIAGAGGNDNISGQGGNDQLIGGNGNDTATGGQGNDTLTGGAGNDQLSGDAGRDRLSGDNGNDMLVGGDGNDTLSGGSGRDNLEGGRGADRLNGGNGNDTLIGGSGDDTMIGGNGVDTFVFEPGGGESVIEDFQVGTDLIDLSAIPEITNFAEFQASARTLGGSTVVFLDDPNGFTISGVPESALSADDIIFV